MYDINLFTFHIMKQHYSFDLVEKAAEIKQISFSRLLSYWKRRIATTLQRENALFIYNILHVYATLGDTYMKTFV